MNLDKIIKRASEYELECAEAIKFAQSKYESLTDFVNSFALGVARGYQEGEFDFEYSDGAVNWLFGFMTEDAFLKETNNSIPSPAFDIYLAFDEGEHLHEGDSDDTDTEEKYTKPRIKEILSANYS